MSFFFCKGGTLLNIRPLFAITKVALYASMGVHALMQCVLRMEQCVIPKKELLLRTASFHILIRNGHKTKDELKNARIRLFRASFHPVRSSKITRNEYKMTN